MNKLYSTLLSVLCFMSAGSQLPAFPGAEGFGKYAVGGRGGKVVAVINLNDTGTGSFRWALEQFPDDPLTIVFRVSGIITLNSEIKIKRSNLTIAGQTAPGDGICLKGHSLILNGARAASLGGNHGNIIIRYLRSRPGSTLPTGVYGFDMENCHNVIVDHCSFSWANEENAALYDNKFTTVQWCIVSEGLYNAGHSKGLRSYGGVWGGQYASYHHNLIAHNQSRTARFNGARAHDTIALIDYRNNVIYNWGSSNACYGGEIEIPNGVSRVNLVNNYYKPGQATSSTKKFVQAYHVTTTGKTGRWHLSGNTMVGQAAMTADNWLGLDLGNVPLPARDTAKSDTAFMISAPLPLRTAQQAYDSVLAYAGAILPKRDSVDIRIVNETATGTATAIGPTSNKWGIIDAPSQVGGWPVYNTYNVPADSDNDGIPDVWEVTNGLNPLDSADRNNLNTDGYTMLEVYLNGITTSANPMPLKLTSFFVTSVTHEQVALSFTTEQEMNVDGFVVERSINGQAFEAIGKVAARNTPGFNSYQFTDGIANDSRQYYRLKLVDKDGSFTYSHIVNAKAKHAAQLALSPNPATNLVTLKHATATAEDYVEVFSVDGSRVLVQHLAANSRQTLLDVSRLNRGHYILVHQHQSSKEFIQFIKN